MSNTEVKAPVVDRSWVSLEGLTPDARGEAIGARFRAIAAAPEDERDRRLEAMIRAEYDLEGVALSDFTLLRLRALLDLASVDADAAQIVARGYDAVFDRLPAELAMRRAVTVQTVARLALRPEEIEGLRALIPSLLRQIPGAPRRSTTSSAEVSRVRSLTQRIRSLALAADIRRVWRRRQPTSP